MQAVDKEVIGQILNWLRAGTRCWLATVVETWGSSPRPVGSLLACNSDGVMVGSLSGGCVEDDLQEKLLNSELAPERPQFFQYGVTPEDVEKFGLPCGGAAGELLSKDRLDSHTCEVQATSGYIQDSVLRSAAESRSRRLAASLRSGPREEGTPACLFDNRCEPKSVTETF